MKLNATQKKKLESKIKHIVGTCQCPATSRTCIYWKNIDRRDKGGDDWQAKEIIKALEKL